MRGLNDLGLVGPLSSRVVFKTVTTEATVPLEAEGRAGTVSLL